MAVLCEKEYHGSPETPTPTIGIPALSLEPPKDASARTSILTGRSSDVTMDLMAASPGADRAGAETPQSRPRERQSLLERRNARNNKDSMEVESLAIDPHRSPAALGGAVPPLALAPRLEAAPALEVKEGDDKKASDEKAPHAFPVQTIVPSYVVDKLIGTGSSSTVHRAHDVNSGKSVALKQFTRNADDEEILQFIREEFDILRKFHHNNIVKPIRLEEDYGEASKVRVVMILEYGGSMTLTQYVQRNKTLAEDDCRGLSLQLFSAIFYIHCKKYVHRDVKPDNIVLSSARRDNPDAIPVPVTQGSPAILLLKMIDFNTATCFGSSSLHMPIWLSPPVTTQEMADLVQSIKHKRKLRVDYSMLLTPTGTGLYQAGEVVTGHDYTEKVDIWSAGMTMLYMICGADVARPQGRIRSHIQSHTKVIRALTPECTNLLDEMLQPNPVARASALQCYTHPWFACDIPRSKRRGRLQNYRGAVVRDGKKESGRSKGTAAARSRTSERMRGERSQSAPPCPTARLQLMWFESLAMRQTYVVQMKREKATHQELIVSLSQNIIAYPGGTPQEGEGKLIELPQGSGVVSEIGAKNKNWRTTHSIAELPSMDEEKPQSQKNSSCSCCRRRSAKVEIESPTPYTVDVVVDVTEEEETSEIVPAHRDNAYLQRSGSSQLVRKSSDKINDDKSSRVSDAESSKTKNSKNSRNTQLTTDSKKYIQTCSWMFRDETDNFAIRLPEGATATEAPFTLNLSGHAVKEGPFADKTPELQVENASSGGGRGSKFLGQRPSGSDWFHRDGGLSEASLSHVAGSETTGSRTALSQATTKLLKNGNLKELFNMIWSARGFRRKFSRECPF